MAGDAVNRAGMAFDDDAGLCAERPIGRAAAVAARDVAKVKGALEK
jgi:hypothetical protein